MIINPHEQHRDRMRKMFLYCNPEKLPDHMLLEFLLFYSMPRVDTNPIAHELINRFGSIENVLDADVEDLLSVPEIGERTALLLKLIPLFCDRYTVNKLKPRVDFRSVDRAADFFMEYYVSKGKEEVCALLLDNDQRLICHVALHEGAVNSSGINVRKLAQIALSYNAAGMILAHNHPSGDPTPSDADLHTTKNLMKAFSAIDLQLRAHLIIAGNRYADAVQTVYDNARYEVKYMAVRSDELPRMLLDEEDLPFPRDDGLHAGEKGEEGDRAPIKSPHENAQAALQKPDLPVKKIPGDRDLPRDDGKEQMTAPDAIRFYGLERT